MLSQAQLFYSASRRCGDADATFMELVNHPTNPLTREDLEAKDVRLGLAAIQGRRFG